MNWRVFAASAIGKQHVDAGLPCQDAIAFDTREGILVAVVCDGAGSASHSDIGAQTFSQDLVRRLTAIPPALPTLPEMIKQAVSEARATLESLATERQIALRDLACTLVGAIIAPERGVLFHIGDGLGIAEIKEGSPVISSPENGEYANETWFVTGDDWEPHLKITPFEGTPVTLALMSDGAMPFVMNREHNSLFGPFIDPVRKYLASVSEEEGSAGLHATLADERTWSITGDDKTLLIVLPA